MQSLVGIMTIKILCSSW